MHDRPNNSVRHGNAGFTLVEVIFVILLIAILLSITLVGIQAASRSAQGASDGQSVRALKVAVDSFKQEFGFLPPLVKGAQPPFTEDPYDPGTKRINVYNPSDPTDRDFLRGRSGTTFSAEGVYRYSLQSLPYFLAGSLDADADGVAGPGFRAPRRDGTYSTSGQTYPSYIDVSKRTLQIWQSPETDRQFVYELRDRNGLPIRFYRWLREPTLTDGLGGLNIPKILGDSAADGSENASPADGDPGLRDAEYAIVAAGPNRAFGDIATGSGDDEGTESVDEVRKAIGASASKAEKAVVQEARKDNIVEAGK